MSLRFRTIYTFILIILILAITASGLKAGRKNKVKCDFCREEIRTQYIQAGKKYFHPIHFLCENCGKVMDHKEYYLKDDHYYDKNCLAELFAPKCNYCGEAIEDEYTIYNHLEYHQYCFEFKIALRCVICSEIIKGDYLQDFWDNNYHKEHENDYNLCEYCGRFITEALTGGGETYADGRHVCGVCLKSSVTKNSHALRLLEDVRNKLAIDGIYVTDKIQLHLVDRNRLKKISGNHLVNPAGYTVFEWKSILEATGSTKSNIYILKGVPEIEFIATAAHEMMHVWQYKNAKKDNDKALSEGSCNYAILLVLRHYPGEYADYKLDNMENDPHELYGNGYRRVKRLVRKKGLDFWLEHLKTDRNFPRGY